MFPDAVNETKFLSFSLVFWNLKIFVRQGNLVDLRRIDLLLGQRFNGSLGFWPTNNK